MNNQPYLVVGGGLAGLTASIALAERGCAVTLVEQSHKLGGRAQTEVRDGYAFNLGPHALYRGGLAERALRQWGIPFTGRTPIVKSNSYLVAEGECHAFPADALGLLSTSAFAGMEKLRAARVFQALMSRDVAASATVQEWLSEKTRPGRARMLAETMIRLSTYATDLSRMSARAALVQVQQAIKSGVLYIDGGWETLIAGLAAKAASMGVRIETGKSLESVELNGRVILAVPPSTVEKLTDATLPALTPIHMATLDIALKSLPAKATVFALGLDTPIYFSRHTATASLAPQGGEVIHVAKYGAGDRAELEAFATLVMPGWRDHVAYARFLPHLVVSHALWTPAGRPRVDTLPGVAICGDWVGDEGMLADAAVASALRAVEFIAGGKRAMAA